MTLKVRDLGEIVKDLPSAAMAAIGQLALDFPDGILMRFLVPMAQNGGFKTRWRKFLLETHRAIGGAKKRFHN